MRYIRRNVNKGKNRSYVYKIMLIYTQKRKKYLFISQKCITFASVKDNNSINPLKNKIMFVNEKKLTTYTKDMWAESISKKFETKKADSELRYGGRLIKNYEFKSPLEMQMGQEIWLISSITITTFAKRKAQLCFTSYEKIDGGKRRSNNRHPKYTMLSVEQLQSLYKQM